MREIKWIVAHCTASSPNATPEKIQNYWKEHLGWKNPGYHVLIGRNGEIHRLLPDDKISNGVGGGYNTNSLNVSYIGGIDANGKAVDNRTDAQKTSLELVITEWKKLYPNAEILGHRDFWYVYKYKGARKACPCYSAIEEYAHIN